MLVNCILLVLLVLHYLQNEMFADCRSLNCACFTQFDIDRSLFFSFFISSVRLNSTGPEQETLTGSSLQSMSYKVSIHQWICCGSSSPGTTQTLLILYLPVPGQTYTTQKVLSELYTLLWSSDQEMISSSQTVPGASISK